MAFSMRRNRGYAFVGRGRIGEVQERPLHYLGKKRTHVCGCDHPGRHFDKTYSVIHESRYLNAGLSRYLDQYCLKSCSIADYHEYCRQQMADWAIEGMYVGRFHYMSPQKNVVCRCSDPLGHNYGAPRNPEIIEECAEFFSLYKGELVVTKDQWKGRDGNLSPAYSTVVRDHLGYMPGWLPDSFRDTGETAWLPVLPEMPRRSATERLAPVIPRHRRVVSVQEQQPEIHPDVWQKARPSRWKSQSGTSSSFSTPMGSVPPTRPSSPSVAPNVTRRASSYTTWSHNQLEGDVSQARSPRVDSPFDTSSMRSAVEGILPNRSPNTPTPRSQVVRPSPRSYPDIAELPTSTNSSRVYELGDNEFANSRRTPPFEYDRHYRGHPFDRAYEKDDDRPSPIPFYDNRGIPIPLGFDEHDLAVREPVAELSGRRSPVELPVAPARQRHTPTLNELEGRDWNGRNWDTPAELEGRPSRDWHQQTCNNSRYRPILTA